jgi:magnesium-transporting ATPase (P-type)
MFSVFLTINLLVSLLTAMCIILFLYRPVVNFLKRHFHDESVVLLSRLIGTGIIVAAIAIGTRVWELEGFITSTGHFDLSRDQIAFEIYKTVVATMQVVALLLFVLFVIVGIAVMVRRKSETMGHGEQEVDK